MMPKLTTSSLNQHVDEGRTNNAEVDEVGDDEVDDEPLMSKCQRS